MMLVGNIGPCLERSIYVGTYTPDRQGSMLAEMDLYLAGKVDVSFVQGPDRCTARLFRDNGISIRHQVLVFSHRGTPNCNGVLVNPAETCFWLFEIPTVIEFQLCHRF